MNRIWRPISAAVSAVGMLALGLSASVPTAQAATTTVTINGILNTASGPCSDGYVYLRVWVVDTSSDSGGYWSYATEAGITGGSYSFDASSYIGHTATVDAYCEDGNTSDIWFGGSIDVAPTSPNAANSKTLVGGVNDFGALLAPQWVGIGGKITQVDGSQLPVWDKNGVLLTTEAQAEQSAKYGIDAWVRFYMPGANVSTDSYVASCYTDYMGLFGTASDDGDGCSVPVGTYDARVFASGYDSRAIPLFNYPQTIALLQNYQVTGANLGLALKTAAGPASVLASPVKIGGTVKVGNTVTAVPGVWNNLGFSAGNPTFGYQWLVNGAAVSTAENYTLQPGDANKSLVLRVTVSRPLFDSATAESAAALIAAPDDTRIAPAATAKFGKLKHSKKATVKVVVKAGGMGALGKIVVAEGSKTLGSKALVAKNNGSVSVKFRVPKAKGMHTITVTYLGNAQVKGIVVTKVVKVK